MYENHDFYPISVDGKNSNSLNVFLRKSSLLCESLMNEQSNLKNEKKKEMSQSKVADGKIFNSNVITLGVKNKMSEEKESEMVIYVLLLLLLLLLLLKSLSSFSFHRYSILCVIIIITIILLLLSLQSSTLYQDIDRRLINDYSPQLNQLHFISMTLCPFLS